ncbi:MAG: FlgD immunoglobulin-like domain containing protein [Candidatus Zixiibacteriota bacterium]
MNRFTTCLIILLLLLVLVSCEKATKFKETDGKVPFAFTLTEEGRVFIAINNALGHRVRTLSNNQVWPAGNHMVEWDGKNDKGEKVMNGYYMLVIEVRNLTGEELYSAKGWIYLE